MNRLLYLTFVFALYQPDVIAANENREALSAYQRAYQILKTEVDARKKQISEENIGKYKTFFDSQLLHNDKELRNSEDELEVVLIDYLKLQPKSPYRPFALFQLGSLYFKRGEVDLSYYSKAAKAYNEVVTRYPDFSHREYAYYLLGYSYLQEDKEAQAVNTFATLVKQFPKSRFVNESRLRIAEYFFHHQKYARALPYYQSIAEAGEANPFYTKALYKEAWVYYLTNQYASALKTFVKILELPEETEFTSEATDYSAFSLVKIRPQTDVVRYLRTLGSQKSTASICLRYGRLLIEDGRGQLAARVFTDTHRSFRGTAEGNEALYLATLAQAVTNNREQQLAAEKLYLLEYPENTENRKSVLFSVASYYYEGWRKRRFQENALEQAREFFSEIIVSYPDSKEAYESSFFAGEASFILKDYQEATNRYRDVILSSFFNNHFEEAVRSTIIALDRRIAGSSDPVVKKLLARELLVTLDEYYDRSSSKKKRSELLFKSAQTLTILGRNDDAIARYNKVKETFPTSPLAQESVRAIVEILLESKDWQKVQVWTTYLLQDPSVRNDPALTKQLRGAAFDATVEIAKSAEEKQNYLLAANLLYRLAKKNPSAPQNSEIIQHTFNLYRRAEQPDLAELTLKEFVNSNPDALASSSVEMGLLAAYENRMDLDGALKFITSLKGSSTAGYQKLKLVANLETKRGNFKRAAVLHIEAAKQTKKSSERYDHVMTAAQLAEQAQDYSYAATLYHQASKMRRSPESCLGAARNLNYLDKTLQAATHLGCLRSQQSQLTQEQKTEWQYLRGQYWAIQFYATPTLKNGEINGAKLDQLDKAEKYFLQSIQTGGYVWSNASIYALAELYLELSREISKLGDEELAAELNAKGREIHSQNKEFAKEGVVNIWIKNSMVSLEDSQSPKYPWSNKFINSPASVFYLPPFRQLERDKFKGKEVSLDGKSRNFTKLIDEANDLISKNENQARVLSILRAGEESGLLSAEEAFNLALLYFDSHDFSTSLSTLTKHVGIEKSPDGQMLKAMALTELSQHEAAKTIFERLLKSTPDSYAIQFNYAVALWRQGQLKQAQMITKRLYEDNFRNPKFMLFIFSLFKSLKRVDEGLYFIRKANNNELANFLDTMLELESLAPSFNIVATDISTENKDHSLINSLGYYFAQAGAISTAESLFNVSASKAPSKEVYYNLALVQFNDGKIEEASKSYETYIMLGGKLDQFGEYLNGNG